MRKILIIDDERGVRESLSLILDMEGYEVTTEDNAVSAIGRIDSGHLYDFILCDVKMPGMGGLEFLSEVQKRDVSSIIIMISAYGSIETSIEAIKKGAADYISKPVNSEELILRMHMALERRQLRLRNKYLRKELGKREEFRDIISSSEIMDEVLDLAKKASEFKTTVLITGESGTGKEVIAKAIHNGSSRKNGAFIAVNCAAIPESLMESELFGYKEGAFSGADNSKRGLFEEAHGGTLFLDEIGEIPTSLQPKLLRVLQENEIRRLGDTKTLKIDTRVIAATSRNLETEVRKGAFRDDLYYRVNVFPIKIPPLRDRREDIPDLVRHFIEKYRERLKSKASGIEQKVLDELKDYSWPGNIRELENVIERALILCDSETIDKVDLGSAGNAENRNIESWLHSMSFEEAKQMIEKSYIDKALSETGGNRTKAAKILGISRRSLFYKLKDIEES